MNKLLLHPKTKAQAEGLLSNPPNSLLISGVDGSGKETLALHVAARLLDLPVDKLANYAYYQRINPSDDSISINEVRDLQQFLKLKVPANAKKITRVVLLDRAERMRTEAQNALLKTLEEPPTDTTIILTASNPEQLLPTISSRTQDLAVLPVSEAQAVAYFTLEGKKSSEIAKYYALSQGQVGLLYSLLGNEPHPLIDKVELAKQILSEAPAARLHRVDELAKDKQQVKLLLNAFLRIARAALSTSAKQQKLVAVEQWRKRQELLVQQSNNLAHNPNTKLLLDNLFLSL